MTSAMDVLAVTKKLVTAVDETVSLLRRHDEQWWAQWLARDAARLRVGDPGALGHLMTSFNDDFGNFGEFRIDPALGHRVTLEELDEVNAQLAASRENVKRLAAELQAAIADAE